MFLKKSRTNNPKNESEDQLPSFDRFTESKFSKTFSFWTWKSLFPEQANFDFDEAILKREVVQLLSMTSLCFEISNFWFQWSKRAKKCFPCCCVICSSTKIFNLGQPRPLLRAYVKYLFKLKVDNHFLHHWWIWWCVPVRLPVIRPLVVLGLTGVGK